MLSRLFTIGAFCLSLESFAQHTEIECLQLITSNIEAELNEIGSSVADFYGWVELKANDTSITYANVGSSKTNDTLINSAVIRYFLTKDQSCLFEVYRDWLTGDGLHIPIKPSHLKN